MTSILTRFSVKGLFERFDVDIPVEKDRLVLVGENGSGKSTVVSLLYYLLTAQWSAMSEMPFESLTAVVAGREIVIVRAQLQACLERRRRRPFGARSRLPRVVANRLQHHIQEGTVTARLLSEFEDVYRIPERYLIEFLETADSIEDQEGLDLRELASYLKTSVTDQVLFLPTFRRIERDLNAIFPEIDIGDALRHRGSRPGSGEPSGYLELVEFGMTDVKSAFAETMQALDRGFRTDLNRLTGEYLRDVIQKKHKKVDIAQLRTVEVGESVETTLRRIGDEILPAAERDALRKLIGKIQRNDEITSDEKIIAHFLAKLVRIHEAQQDKEAHVRSFVTVCNGYLTNKQVVFDAAEFRIHLCQSDRDGAPSLEKPIPLKGLSSGEKQIVSLFAHIFLSGAKGFFVIIDEPELSISVTWQKKFLTDLIGTGLCNALVAVTHSPFIFQNSLADSAHSMAEFTTVIAE